MAYRAEIEENTLVTVRNPDGDLRVHIAKYEVNECTGEVEPVKNKYAMLRPSQYAVLRNTMQMIRNEIELRQKHPDMPSTPIQQHLGGNYYAAMNESYDLLNIRQFYYEKPAKKTTSAFQPCWIPSECRVYSPSPADDECSSDSAVSLPGQKRKLDDVDGARPTKIFKCNPLHSSNIGRTLKAGKPGVSLAFPATLCLFDQIEIMDKMFPQLQAAKPCSHDSEQQKLRCWLCNPQ